MGMWTDWFIADESEAEAIASIVETEAHDFEDWPHLAMKGIIESQLMALWGVLQGKSGEWPNIIGDVLYQAGEAGEEGFGEDGAILVTSVHPEFVQALSKQTDSLAQMVETWLADESMDGWTAEDATAILREMSEFARDAEKAGKPVLQLVVV